jgi:hypothetical protein
MGAPNELLKRIERADSLRRAKPAPARQQARGHRYLVVKGCLPMALALPVMNNGDFGTSPLFCRPSSSEYHLAS